MRGSGYQIFKHYPELYEEIRKQIAIEAEKHHIDFNKICYDTKRKDEMFYHQKKIKK